MRKIYFKNIKKDTLKVLQESFNDIILEPYQDQPVDENVVSFIIGEEGYNIIPVIQSISRNDPDISILVMPSTPHLTEHLKVALQFTPFISKHVKIISMVNQEELKEFIEEQADLTLKRRNFRITTERSKNIVNTSLKLDSLSKSKYFDTFISQAPMGVILLDQSLKILDYNQISRVAIPEIENNENKTILNLFGGEQQTLKKFIQAAHSSDENIILQHNDTATGNKYYRFYKSDIHTDDQLYYLLTFLDETQIIEAEKKSQEYLKDLEQHSKDLEQFASVVTHDIKNPLSTILLSCEMAEDGDLKEKEHYLKIIQRSANNLMHMLEGLEEMIDIRRDRGQKSEKLFFEDILENVLNEYHYQIEANDIRLSYTFKKAPEIRYIKSYLISIFHNMISNAIKYSKKEEPLQLIIETEKRGKCVILKIKDNGIGIDLDKDGKYLFKPFHRLTQQANGKGIGLSLIKSMIEKNNGRIEVESEPGVGTTFICYLNPYEDPDSL